MRELVPCASMHALQCLCPRLRRGSGWHGEGARIGPIGPSRPIGPILDVPPLGRQALGGWRGGQSPRPQGSRGGREPRVATPEPRHPRTAIVLVLRSRRASRRLPTCGRLGLCISNANRPQVGQASCLPISGLQAGRLHHIGNLSCITLAEVNSAARGGRRRRRGGRLSPCLCRRPGAGGSRGW